MQMLFSCLNIDVSTQDRQVNTVLEQVRQGGLQGEQPVPLDP